MSNEQDSCTLRLARRQDENGLNHYQLHLQRLCPTADLMSVGHVDTRDAGERDCHPHKRHRILPAEKCTKSSCVESPVESWLSCAFVHSLTPRLIGWEVPKIVDFFPLHF